MELRSHFLVLGWIMIAVLVSACGDDEDDSAAAKCEHVIDVYCNKGVDCVIGAGWVDPTNRADEFSECVTAAKQEVACGKAKGVDDSYDDCLADIEAMTCTPILQAVMTGSSPLPANCVGVIK